MNILDKVTFWKKNDNLGLGDLNDVGKLPGEKAFAFPQEENMRAFPSPDPFAAPQPSMLPQQQNYASPFAQQFPPPHDSRELDLVVAKIDALKATLESINQRLANIERIAEGEANEEEYAKQRRGW